MSTSKSLIGVDRLINLFGLFVLGTMAYILYTALPSGLQLSWWTAFYKSLPIIIFLSYEVVILSLISHYATKGKNKIVDYINTHKKQAIYIFVAIVLISYLVLAFLISSENRIFNGLFHLIGLIIGALVFPFTNKKINEWLEKKF